MKEKEIYNKPEIEVINLDVMEIIAASHGSDLGDVDPADPNTGGYSKRREFWNN